ncbi:MAG TPA: class II aldolase/adducin family protein, partial [Chitinispirillaceae bacterium]|nr:class II aldolase/adducin family protein [Chitinispirillaceae bacterium]
PYQRSIFHPVLALKLQKKEAEMTIHEIKKKIVQYTRLTQSRGYTVASEGNISVRLPDGYVMITPTKIIKDFITEDDLVVVDMDGNHVDGTRKATTERFTHLAIYRKRHDIDCIVHAHPVYTVLSTVLGTNPFEQVFISEAAMFLKKVAYAAFAKPSTKEGADAVRDVCGNSDVIVIDRHGSFTCGKDIETAFSLLEILEKYCKMYYLASMSGKPINFIDPSIVEELRNIPY